MALDTDSWWLDELAHAGREHHDEEHSRRYDVKEDAGAAAEVALLTELGVAGPGRTVVDLGAGTGQFTLAAAETCGRVVAVDVSPIMLARLTEKLERETRPNVDVARAGFLTYEHTGAPADAVYSRLALHHLPDFFKALALARLADMLRPGGIFRLVDVVYAFEPREAEERVERWIAEFTSAGADVEQSWTRAELAEHVRDEQSTYTWLLEPMIERAGLEIATAEYDDHGIFARYVCTKPA